MIPPGNKYCLSFPGIPGLCGWVTVDGQPLEVYGAKMEGRKAVGYIEAKEGSRFDIRFIDQRGPASPVSHNVDLVLDGLRVNGIVRPSGDRLFSFPPRTEQRITTFSGKEESSTTIRPFLFAKLETTDDDGGACSNEATIKSLGSIQLKYWRVTNLQVVQSFAPALHDNKPLHERSKLATLSHRADYASSVARTAKIRLSYTMIDPVDAPLATIEFRYRSRRLLQLEGYIADSPTISHRPSSPPIDLDDDATEAELESLKRQERIAQLEREKRRRSGGGGSSSGGGASGSGSTAGGKKRVKPEPGETDVEMLKRVKKEEGERIEQEKKENKKKGKKTEVIDLCDSD